MSRTLLAWTVSELTEDQCDLTGDTGMADGWKKMRTWEDVFLQDAKDRLNDLISVYEFSIRDVAAMVSPVSPQQ